MAREICDSRLCALSIISYEENFRRSLMYTSSLLRRLMLSMQIFALIRKFALERDVATKFNIVDSRMM